MSKREGQIALGAFLYFHGHHAASWLVEEVEAKEIFDIDYYIKGAKIAEKGLFDNIFLADYLYLLGVENSASGMLDPVNLLSALSVVTKNIGLTATVSTTYNEPFHLARRHATLDHLSKGRAGWNIVTSQLDIEAQNFGKEKHLEHGERYKRADEFLAATKALWDSWEDDAIVDDKQKGIFARPGSVKEVNFNGEWYKTRGPLNVPRSPQGYPVLVVAGSSATGIDFAARNGEVVFTAHQTIEQAKLFYKRVKEAATTYNRNPNHIKIMPGIMPYIGKTKEEAQEKYDRLTRLIPIESAIGAISSFFEFDFTTFDPNGPLPYEQLENKVEEYNRMKSRIDLFIRTAKEQNLTIADLGRRLLGGRGHYEFIGTYDEFVETLETWFNDYACDGFNIMAPVLPSDLEDFVDEIIPRLQSKGLFRTEYEGTTLRDNLGLPRPLGRVNVEV